MHGGLAHGGGGTWGVAHRRGILLAQHGYITLVFYKMFLEDGWKQLRDNCQSHLVIDRTSKG